MKGIILAGGNGTRLHPITLGTSKQMLPVYDKPMIYYPLSVLMLAGITDILVISSPQDLGGYQRLLGDGSWLGLSVSYAEQEKPHGIADAFIVGSDFIDGSPVALILGDNIFHGQNLGPLLQDHIGGLDGCVLFGYSVRDPERYGVGETDQHGNLTSIEEKPEIPRSNLAITGLYLYDSDVVDIARSLQPSDRGELEITDVNRVYLKEGRAYLYALGRGFAWLDTGSHEALTEASMFVRISEQRQGIRIACIEEIAWRMGLISAEELYRLGQRLSNSGYGQYICEVASSAPLETPGALSFSPERASPGFEQRARGRPPGWTGRASGR